MKKIYQGLFIGVLLISGLSVFFMARARKDTFKSPAVSVQPDVSVRTAVIPPQESQPKKTIKIETTPIEIGEVYPQQPIEEYLKEFLLPQKLEAELIEASKKREVSLEWGEGKISEEELQRVGLTLVQLSRQAVDNKTKNITAGFSVSEKAFAQDLNNCLPEEAVGEAAGQATEEDEQTRILNSEALSAIGFSALMEHNYTQAEKAFSALIRDYADTEPVPMAHLELARLVFEQGRPKEAQQLVDKAIYLYSNDKEYVLIAQGLKKEIEANE